MRKVPAREQPRNSLRQHPNREMRDRVGTLTDRGREIVAKVGDKNFMDANHQIEERGTVAEDDAEEFRRLGGRIENRIDRDLEFLGRRMKARLRLAESAAQFSRAMLDQLDKDFVFGLEVQVERAEADVGFGRNVGDARLMVSLARDDALGRLDQIDSCLLATAIESIWSISRLSSNLTHRLRFYWKMNCVSITIIDSVLNL